MQSLTKIILGSAENQELSQKSFEKTGYDTLTIDLRN